MLEISEAKESWALIFGVVFVRFTEPMYRVLLLPLLGWVWWTGRGLLSVSKARRRTILFLRGLLITLIVLALAGAQWVMTPNRVCRRASQMKGANKHAN